MAKTKTEILKELAADTASATHRGMSSVQQAASKAGDTALAAGKSVQHVIGGAIEHATTKGAVTKAKAFADSATLEARKLTGRVIDTVKAADANHKKVADKVEIVSMGLGITAGVAAAGAAIAAPAGLGAIGVAIGVTSAPLIVTAAPIIGAAAAVTGVVSGGGYFYSKWKSKKEKDEAEQPEQPGQPD